MEASCFFLPAGGESRRLSRFDASAQGGKAAAGKVVVAVDSAGKLLRKSAYGYKGVLPPELELSNEVASLRRLVLELEEGEERRSKVRELNFKLMKLEMTRKRPLSLDLLPQYQEKLLDKLEH